MRCLFIILVVWRSHTEVGHWPFSVTEKAIVRSTWRAFVAKVTGHLTSYGWTCQCPLKSSHLRIRCVILIDLYIVFEFIAHCSEQWIYFPLILVIDNKRRHVIRVTWWVTWVFSEHCATTKQILSKFPRLWSSFIFDFLPPVNELRGRPYFPSTFSTF